MTFTFTMSSSGTKTEVKLGNRRWQTCFSFSLMFHTAVKALIKLAIAACKEPISRTISFSPFQTIVKYNHSSYVLVIF